MTVAIGPLGFGGAPVGNLYRPVSEGHAWDALEAAWQEGVRYFDTAPHYGLGLSERRIGEFLASKPRGEYVVSTKVGRLLTPNPGYAGGDDLEHGFDVPDEYLRVFDPTLSGVRKSLEASLDRMGLDRIDILYLHDPDAYDLETGLTYGLPALESIRDDGLTRQIGIGVNDSAVAARAVQEADLDLVMIAGRYTMLDQSAEQELFPACRANDTKVIAAAPFNSGLLATSRPRPDATYDYGPVPEHILERVDLIAEVCAAHGVALPAAALQFPLRHPLVESVVVGSARAEAVRENSERMQTPIPVGFWVDIASVAEVNP